MRRERFVKFDQIDVVPRKAAAREQALGCGNRANAHPAWLAARRCCRMKPCDWFEAQLFQLVFCHDKAGGGGIVLLAGVASRNHAAFEGAQLAQAFGGCISAVAFIVIEYQRIALFLRHRHGHEFIIKQSRGPSRSGALVRAGGICIGGFAGYPIILCQIFGGFDHSGDHAKPFGWLRHQPSACQPVVQDQIAGTCAFADVGAIMLDIRHRFRAARDHHIGHARLDHHRRIDHRLQARAAAPIEHIAGHLERETSGQPRPVANRRRFAIAIALGKNDIIDPRGIDLGALHQCLEHNRAQIGGGERGKRAAEFADGGADRGDNGGAAKGFGHAKVPTMPVSISRAISPDESFR